MDTSRLFSLEAEAGVLGSIILDPDVLMGVMQIITSEDLFFLPEHQKMYECLVGLFIEHTPIDPVALRTSLKAKGWLGSLGDGDDLAGTLYIGKVMESVPSSANAAYYAGVVVDRARYRGLIQTSQNIQDLLQEHEDTATMAEQMQRLVLSQDIGPQQQYAEIDAEEAAIDMTNTDKYTLHTYFPDLDKKVNFGPGDVVIVAGRPSMGKSALTSNIVQNMARDDIPVLIISLEMTPVAITKRMIARESRVNARYVAECDLPKIAEAAEAVGKLPIMVAEHTTTATQIMGLVAQLKASKGIQVVVLDYIQLMGGSKVSQNRNNELAAISRTLKLIAQEYEILFFVVSQLNRGVEARNDKHPKMSDLRDSGAIEQDADWVLLLYRADYYRNKGDDKDGLAELHIAKARDGETGNVDLVFLPELTSFETLAR